jgi:hypothetical protein
MRRSDRNRLNLMPRHLRQGIKRKKVQIYFIVEFRPKEDHVPISVIELSYLFYSI